MLYGVPEERGLRCAYHGWLFAETGQCLEQPFEDSQDPEGRFRDKVRITAYPVQQMAGLLFAYLGPEPAPLLPRWDVLVREDGTRKIQLRGVLDCNWLQIQENTADTVHTYYLHGHTMKLKGRSDANARYYYRPIVRYDFRYCEWGIEKMCTYGGDVPEEEVRPPLIFPNILRIPEGHNENIHWRVPVDDTHTRIVVVRFRPAAPGSTPPKQDTIPVEEVAADFREDGDYSLDTFGSQDRMAWETQGPVFDRSAEHLGATDRGIVMFRRLLEQQIAIVERGGEPMALMRDPAKNRIISFTSHSLNRLEDPSAELGNG